jgi:hypothetical protein
MPLVSKTFSQIITFTRASSATYFDATGTLQTATTDVPRFDYNPTTLAAQGFLIEESRTNSIRNNTMQGAAAGTPGTLPTNWNVVAGGLGTLTQQVVGTGTANGITYIDIKLSGTTSTTSVGYSFESTTQIVAANGQTWTSSFWAALQAGSLTNISTVENRVVERDAAGASLGTTITDFKSIFTSTLTRIFTTRTLSNASAARVTNDIVISFSSGVAIDITLRIGLPQLEQGAFATSVIPTTSAAVTRAADVASVNTLSPWYNATEGTLYAEGVPISPSSSFTRVASIEDSAFNNVISIQRNGTDARGFGDGVSTIVASAMPQNTVFKAALGAKINDFALSVNGSAVNLDTTTNALPTANRLGLGATTAFTSYTNLWLRRVTYYPRRLSNAELQSLTV